MPTVESNLPSSHSGDLLLREIQSQLEVANKRLRDYEEQSEFEEKRKALREELAVVTNRLLELENGNIPTSSNAEVHSSSPSGVHTLSPP